jgi:hypothetical protein
VILSRIIICFCSNAQRRNSAMERESGEEKEVEEGCGKGYGRVADAFRAPIFRRLSCNRQPNGEMQQ